MTKGIACAQCTDLRLLSRMNLDPVSCSCGNVTGWWLDGRAGVARYTARAPYYAYGVGVNNSFWLAALQSMTFDGGQPPDSEWRELHDKSCEAPGYLFDKSRRNCWVILFKPEWVRDVEWATDEERVAVGLQPYPDGHTLKKKPDEQPTSPT